METLDPNVVQLNEANCIPALLLGLSLHKRDPTVVTNACNALCSMTDAEGLSGFIRLVDWSIDRLIHRRSKSFGAVAVLQIRWKYEWKNPKLVYHKAYRTATSDESSPYSPSKPFLN